MDLTGSRAEHVDLSGRFAPKNGALPNFSETTTWDDLATGSASQLKAAGTYVLQKSAGAYTFMVNDATDVPHMMMTINTTASVTINTPNGANGTPARTFVNTLGNVNFTDADMCCPTCDCSLACDKSHGYPEYGSGFVVRTAGHCDRPSGGALNIIGQVQCATFTDSATGDCIVGKLVGTSSIAEADAANIGCNEPGTSIDDQGCSTSSTICIKNSFEFVGDMRSGGNICTKNNPEGETTIQANGSVAMKNGVVQGSIIATGNVSLGNNAELTWNGAGGSENQGLPAAIWVDAAW